MARRSALAREAINAFRVTAPDVPTEDHFYRCAGCGQRVDRRRLGDVLHHEERGHEPLEIERPVIRPQYIMPMMPTLSGEPPKGDEWQHEIKYDGYRAQLHLTRSEARAFTRNGHDWTERYAPLVSAAAELPCDSAIIDGEVIVQDASGRCDFHALRSTIRSKPGSLVLMAFDLLELDGQDLRRKPLERRRDLLKRLLGPNDPTSPIHFSESVIGDGHALFEAADAMGLEGIVSKRVGSRYRSGSSKDWLKTKCFMEEELVVIGIERGDKAPIALLAREKDGQLEYAGGAMVTLPHAERDRFWAAADRLKVSNPPVPMKTRKDASWTRPEMRVLVRTLRGEEMLRHATIRSLVADLV
jgi:bifunctional non-homologous end joining protein LigD